MAWYCPHEQHEPKTICVISKICGEPTCPTRNSLICEHMCNLPNGQHFVWTGLRPINSSLNLASRGDVNSNSSLNLLLNFYRMPHLISFRFKIKLIVFIAFYLKGNIFNNFKTISNQTSSFCWVVRH
jgi:hypothetical protein